MLKNILKLEGAKKLTKNEEKSINGGTMIELDVPKCYCNGVQVYRVSPSECFEYCSNML